MPLLAHRVAYALVNGDTGDLKVRHSCDNPGCVRPDHLLLGTQAENAHDMVERGRSLVGSRNHRAKLTEAQVADIKRRRACGERGKDIAEEFGVCDSLIAQIVHGKIWRHVAPSEVSP